MIAKTLGATLLGIDALVVDVEVDVQPGMPMVMMVGLPDKAVEDSKERVRSAFRNSDLYFPMGRVIINLAPGDIRKEGPTLDLPIAAAVMISNGDVAPEALADTVLYGELSLDGSMRKVDGALNVALMCASKGIKRLVVPLDNAEEAAVVPGVEVYGFDSLRTMLAWLNQGIGAPCKAAVTPEYEALDYAVDFNDVKGQTHAIRALEIVAAGGHNILMVGPPGTGKTMLARRVVTILPPLGLDEAIAVTQVYSAAGKKGEIKGLVWKRPFRSPHHATSYAAMVGGGAIPKPGEVSLAHHGVLFLDECAEFPRDVLEALRQPLEDSVVTVSRVQATLTFPASCMLVGAMNPCPCGLKGYPDAKCVGNPATCGKYLQRLSGPLLDRIDLHVTVPRLTPEELLAAPTGESSSQIRERVIRAREKQEKRLGAGKINAKMSPSELKSAIQLTDEAQDMMKMVVNRMNLSARVYDRILKVARTIADLAESEQIHKAHIAEATQFRERSEM